MPDFATDAPYGPVSLNSTLRDVVTRPPVIMQPEATIADALRALESGRSDLLVIIEPARGVPLGVLSLREALQRLVHADGDLSASVATVMTGGLTTVSADATVHHATVVMVRGRLPYVLLTNPDGSLFNVVTQVELFGLQGPGLVRLVDAIVEASDVPSLARLATEVRRFAARRQSEGVGAEALCQWISALNDLIALQIIEVEEGRFDLPYVPWCWLVFGSEGRLEQTLMTDQDNGLLFAAESPEHAEQLRRQFLPFAEAVNQALDLCGFPLCKGQIMAGNPKWCLSLDEWRARFLSWIMEAKPEALLNATIFFDFRPLYGSEELAGALRRDLLGWTGEHRLFLRAMATNALDVDPPLGLLGGFRHDDKGHPNTLNLKTRGSRLFVDAARILALAEGTMATNTAERLRSVAARRGQGGEETAALVDAFYHIQRLRLRHEVLAADDTQANRIDPRNLHALDRFILKEAFRQARSLQRRLRAEFQI